MTYTARVHREGMWWVIDVEGVGTTQTRHVHDCAAQAADLIEAMTGKTTPAADVTVTISMPPEWEQKIAAARRATERAAQAQIDAAARNRALVRDLAAREHLSHADMATLLGMSRQRVGQLAAKK